jgi:hypothetical protein
MVPFCGLRAEMHVVFLSGCTAILGAFENVDESEREPRR